MRTPATSAMRGGCGGTNARAAASAVPQVEHMSTYQYIIIHCNEPARTGSSSHSSFSLAATANASASPTSTNASHGPPATISSSELSLHRSISGYGVTSGAANIRVGARGGAQCDMGAKQQQNTRVKGAPRMLLMQVYCPVTCVCLLNVCVSQT